MRLVFYFNKLVLFNGWFLIVVVMGLGISIKFVVCLIIDLGYNFLRCIIWDFGRFIGENLMLCLVGMIL